MKFLLLSVLVLSTVSPAFAADKKKAIIKTSANDKASMKELGKIDSKTLDMEPQSKKEEIADETALYAEPSKVKVNFSCKAKDGHEIKQGEKGYDECLQKVKNDKNNPHEPNADIKVNFGN